MEHVAIRILRDNSYQTGNVVLFPGTPAGKDRILAAGEEHAQFHYVQDAGPELKGYWGRKIGWKEKMQICDLHGA
jgi:hypothetical protein